jgi:hypothetical protein
VVSAAGHRIADVDLDDPGFERTPYDPWAAYGRSKSANVLFAVELDRRLRDLGVRATAVHPREITTDLGRHLTEETRALMAERVGPRKMVFKPVEAGAATSVWAGLVADADTVGGHYCENFGVAAVMTDPVSTTRVFGYALDGDRAPGVVGAVRAPGWASASADAVRLEPTPRPPAGAPYRRLTGIGAGLGSATLWRWMPRPPCATLIDGSSTTADGRNPTMTRWRSG